MYQLCIISLKTAYPRAAPGIKSFDILFSYLLFLISPFGAGTGAAEPCEPRQVREEAAVRRCLRVLPANLPEFLIIWKNKPVIRHLSALMKALIIKPGFWDDANRRYEDASSKPLPWKNFLTREVGLLLELWSGGWAL